MTTHRDYRQLKQFAAPAPLGGGSAIPQYNVPPRPLKTVLTHMQQLAGSYDSPPSPGEVEVLMGRVLPVPYELNGIALFRFADLCATAVGTSDYIAVAENYHTVFLYDVPPLDDFDACPNEIRRFIQLIDVLYERLVRVVIDARAPLLRLFHPSETTQIFQELKTRIQEKYSSDADCFVQDLRMQLKAAPRQSFPAALGSLVDAPEKVTSAVATTMHAALTRHHPQNNNDSTPQTHYGAHSKELRVHFVDALIAALQLHSEYFDLVGSPMRTYLSTLRPNPRMSQLTFSFQTDTSQNALSAADSAGAGDNQFAFQRTLSRIRDMLSLEYLAEHKRRWDIQTDV